MTFDLKRARELVWAVSERKIWTLLERTGYGGDIDKRRERQAITEICDKQFPSAIAEIERLRGEMENYGDDYVCQMKSKDARIQELEDALVEERARRNARDGECSYRTPIKGQLFSKCDKGFLCDWGNCTEKDELRSDAREQLRAEGKIGPDVKPHCWHITDERILAIENAISSCVLIERYTGQDLQHEIAVLRTMLGEIK